MDMAFDFYLWSFVQVWWILWDCEVVHFLNIVEDIVSLFIPSCHMHTHKEKTMY